jgi:TrmH family RNA methyltransferase
MLSRNQISFVNSLKQKKFREEHQLFIAEGAKIVPELFASEIQIKQLYATEGFLKSAQIPSGIECIEVKSNELERISSLTTPNEVLAVCSIPQRKVDSSVYKGKLSLVLDDVKDPGNMGTIIRIADWFGIENIVCSPNSVDVYNPKVVQATMGSIARINIFYSPVSEFIDGQKQNNSLRVFGALLEGENIYSKTLPSEGLIVIGNESRGISAEVQQVLTDKISIPSFSHYKQNSGEAESLNAAIATAIICSEFRRR